MMADNSVIDDVVCALWPEDISSPYLSAIFSAIKDLHDTAHSVDATAVAQRLLDTNNADWINVVRDAKKTDNVRAALMEDLILFQENLGSGAEIRSLLNEMALEKQKRDTMSAITDWQKSSEEGVLGQVGSLIERLSTIQERAVGPTLAPLDFDALPPIRKPILTRGGEPWLFEGEVMLLAGPPGKMKSYLSTTLAGAFVRGRDCSAPELTLGLIGEIANPRVAHFDTELPESTISRRMSFTQTVVGKYYNCTGRYSFFAVCLYSKETRLRMIEMAIRSGKYDLVVIDSVRDICSDFNDLTEAKHIADLLKRLAGKSSCGIIITSHTEKMNNTVRGHMGSQLYDISSLYLLLEGVPRTDNVKIEVIKHRSGNVKGFAFKYEDGEHPHLVNAEVAEDGATFVGIFKENLVPYHTYDRDEILELLEDSHYAKNTAVNYISRAIKMGLLKKEGDKYSLVLPKAPEEDLPED